MRRRRLKLFKKAIFGRVPIGAARDPAQLDIPKQLEVLSSDQKASRFGAYPQLMPAGISIALLYDAPGLPIGASILWLAGCVTFPGKITAMVVENVAQREDHNRCTPELAVHVYPPNQVGRLTACFLLAVANRLFRAA